MITGHYLERLLAPNSVALIGASSDPRKVGGRMLENLRAAGFAGMLYAVNPKYRDIDGLACVPNVAALPAPVELAVIVTPPRTVPGLVDECGRAGIHAVVVITAGFGEAGDEGAALEAEVLAAAHRHGIRLLGPNCLGLMRPPVGLNATFARGNALAGSLALVSQSGAVCTALLDWATPNGVGFSSVISLGGSSDVDFGEIVDFLAADPLTQHILLYIEGVRDGRRLVSSLRAAARIKPVIVMKVGRHPAGSRAAVSHTGAIVGRDDVFDAVVHRTGVVRVATAGELIAAATALAANVHPTGARLAVVTNGGGPGVMAADRAAELDIPLAELSPATYARLAQALPSNWSHGNPVDLIGDADPARYRAALAACLDDPGVDGVVAILTPQAMTEADEAARVVVESAAHQRKPVIACWMGQASVTEARAAMRAAGLPVYRLPETAVEAFAYMAQFHRNQQALLESPPPLAAQQPPDVARAREVIARALAEDRLVLTATESKRVVDAFRIPVVRCQDAATVDEAVRIAGEQGWPVAIKILSRDITHKSDVGGVRLGLANPEAVRAAWDEIMASVKRLRPDARVDGVSVERMVSRPNSRELMVGIASDPVFGPAIAFGAGGIAVEVLNDRAVGLPPLNAKLARDLVGHTRVAGMLGAFRHLPPVDHAAVESVLLHVSDLACELPEVDSLDINPLLADAQGVIALDARVVLRRPPPSLARYGHLAILPYPAELEQTIALASGERVFVRPIRPEDATMEMAFVDSLSQESRRLRFQSALRSLTPTMLARFTQIDYDREMALVAIAGNPEREVGVCRYVRLPDGERCEFAIVLADGWQGRGLGRRLMARLADIARARGLKSMIGFVLAENSAMLRMCTGLGMRIEDEGDGLTRRAVLTL